MIAPNTLLQNRYLVLEQIGQGGMGAVYIATDQRFGSTVALKETFFTDPGLRKAFEREARLLNHLRHAALPRVSDHFVEEEGQFLVMEYIAGEDLSEKLKTRGGAFPLSEVLKWADQLLDGLDYLHTQNPPVIHRDIKPQNLKLTERQHIVLLDFGLAKGTSVQTKVTATGSVFGYSRNYAPLEQIQGAGTDPRSDLYSLGATLYHLITGVTPPDALTRATAVLNGQPDPLLPANEVHAQVTPAVAEVVSRAMAQNAGQRPQTAAAMRDALRDAARQGQTIARETEAPSPTPTNVYEQETQLMFASAPTTREIVPEEKAGTLSAGAAGTSINTSEPASAASASDPDSVVTKVAASQQTTLKPEPRRRTIAIATSAALFIVLAAVVYTFTRNSVTTPTSEQNVQSEPTPPSTSNAGSQQNPESVGSTNQAPSTPAATPQTNPPTSPMRSTRAGKPPGAVREPGQTEVDADNGPPGIPETPDDSEDPKPPPVRPRRDDAEVDEAISNAEEQRRAGVEARRNAIQQRRAIIIRQRQILEREQLRRERRRLP